jgi:two-component system, OmpR family, alkaline phosphatase synthesis response regulator PhoP
MTRVLLVDDESDILELLRYNFELAGFAVHTAASGMEGLHQARDILPDIIILDLLLPDLDGMTICEILRKQPSTASIPIMILTAVGGQICRLAGLDAGADDHITKPISPRDLIQRVRGLLQRKADQQTSESPGLN